MMPRLQEGRLAAPLRIKPMHCRTRHTRAHSLFWNLSVCGISSFPATHNDIHRRPTSCRWLGCTARPSCPLMGGRAVCVAVCVSECLCCLVACPLIRDHRVPCLFACGFSKFHTQIHTGPDDTRPRCRAHVAVSSVYMCVYVVCTCACGYRFLVETSKLHTSVQRVVQPRTSRMVLLPQLPQVLLTVVR
jgi:hypothetical protein